MTDIKPYYFKAGFVVISTVTNVNGILNGFFTPGSEPRWSGFTSALHRAKMSVVSPHLMALVFEHKIHSCVIMDN